MDPVKTADGFRYSRSGIELWLSKNNTSPLTGLVLENLELTPDPDVED